MAAAVAMAGMDPMQFLQEEDVFMRSVMIATAARRRAIAAEERQDLAERIVSVLGRSMK